MPGSLGGRLLLSASVLIVGALLATGIVMDLALRHFIQGQVDGRLDGQILTVADALREAPDGSLRLERTVDGPPFERSLSGWYWEVLPPGSGLRSRSLLAQDFTLAVPTLVAGQRKPVTVDGRGPLDEPLRVRVKEVRLGSAMVRIAAAAPLHALAGPLHDALTPLVVTLVLLAVALIAAVMFQVKVGLRPLIRLEAELAQVRTGETDRIVGPQPREIRPLVTELNTLLDQHAANLERARRHVANLAHGLKTPLATLSLILDEPGRDPDRRLRPLVTTMDRRIRHHLARARAAALGGAERARVPLAPRVAEHLIVFSKLYADKGLAYDNNVDGRLAVACETQDLDEMLGNLLDNASTWARRAVRVTAIAGGARLTVVVDDDGPGLSADQVLDVMRPGQRIDESAPGYGFGLPITRELAELYGGTLTLTRSALGGLSARIDLPAAA